MNKTKYIKVVTYGNFPFGGASANFLKYFSLSLAMCKNNNVEVILPNGHFHGKTRNNSRKGKVEQVNYRYLGFKNHPKNYIGKIIDNLLAPCLLTLYLLVQIINKKIDLIIIYNSFFSQVIPIILMKVLAKRKILVILPEFYEKPKAFVARLKLYDFYMGINHFVRYFDRVIVLSSFLERYVVKRAGKKMKVMILPNIMDPSVFNNVIVDSFKKDKITIGYVGTLTREDGVIDLIKSFALLQRMHIGTHLLIIGDITSGKSVIIRLKLLTKELNIENKVSFTGLVPFTEVSALLNSCQILALTRPEAIYSTAGFPTKLGEYFACKKPVVITKIGDIPFYFTGEKHVILVEPGNIESIAKGFISLIKSPEKAENITNEAYDWMDINLNYRNLSSKLDEFLK